MLHVRVLHATLYNTPQVIKCTPLLSWLFYSYAMLLCYIYIFIIHFLSSKVHHSYPGYSIAMLCYATVLHIYLCLQVIKCTTLLSWLFYSYAKLQCYISTCIFIIHFRSSKVHHKYPSWLFYSYVVLCYSATCISLSYTSGHQIYSTVILAMLGKIGAAAAFAVIYVWSAELYPTVVRNVGMGASSSCARIGGMVSPYIADLVHFTLINITRFVLR